VAPFSASLAAQDLLATLGNRLHVGSKAVERSRGGVAGFCFADRGGGCLLKCGGDFAYGRLDRVGQALDVLRAFLGRLRERSHFVRHDREAPSVVAGSRRLDRRIQGKKVGLIGNAADRARDFADILRPILEFGDHFDRSALPGAVAFDGPDRRADLDGGLRQHDLDGLGAPARTFRLPPSFVQAGDHLLDRRQLFLGRAGRLAGATSNLLHRPPQFFGRRGRLGQSAG
jgi:hypothetical protein